jgi:hypothetical protein
MWVVLIAGSTGSALRAVRSPNPSHHAVARRDLVPGKCHEAQASMPSKKGGSFSKNVSTWRRFNWRRMTTWPPAINPVNLENRLGDV